MGELSILKHGGIPVAELTAIHSHQSTFFAQYVLLESALQPGPLARFHRRCLDHGEEVSDDDFSAFDQLAEGWSVETHANRAYSLDGLPLFLEEDELSFVLKDGQRMPFCVREIVRGTVVSHQHYGAWVKLDALVTGLILIGEISDKKPPVDFPVIGSSVEAVVWRSSLGDGFPTVSLSTRRSFLNLCRKPNTKKRWHQSERDLSELSISNSRQDHISAAPFELMPREYGTEIPPLVHPFESSLEHLPSVQESVPVTLGESPLASWVLKTWHPVLGLSSLRRRMTMAATASISSRQKQRKQ